MIGNFVLGHFESAECVVGELAQYKPDQFEEVAKAVWCLNPVTLHAKR